ncbi:ester cyclase [Chitinophaga agri]|uniref:Ester cyclase n=1 Tax=Chitinophaga agri TaxID=2703787 RepID=A0A6B9ZJ75_9BACT|nr:ester cyclase [Chitinophaga agri]QHS62017.1 ester cyclase [Chitinophaga agri]
MKFLTYLCAALIMPLLSTAQRVKKTKTDMDNKAIIRKMYEDAFNKGNLTELSQFVSDAYPGKFAQHLLPLKTAFPDAQWIIKDMLAEGDKVVVFQQFCGTHKDTFQHIPPTGKYVTGNGIVTYELKGGKIVNTQVLTDRLGFLEALGVR